jgi:hypothetical protein
MNERLAHWLWHNLPPRAPNNWFRWLRGQYSTAEMFKRHGPLVVGPSTPVTREAGAPARGPLLGQPEGYMEDAPRLPVESQARAGIANHNSTDGAVR